VWREGVIDGRRVVNVGSTYAQKRFEVLEA
jgi:hypothetical protein